MSQPHSDADAVPDLDALQRRAEALVDAAKKAGADACDAVAAISRSSGLEVRDGKVDETESAEDDAFTLRAFVGDRSASISANHAGDIAALAERVVAMAKVSPADAFAGLADADRLATDIPDLDLFDATPLSVDAMREMAEACEAAAMAVPGVSKSSGASCGRSVGGSVLVTSHGFSGSYLASRVSLSVSVVAGEGTVMERDYAFDSQRYLATLRDAETIGREAGERTVKRLKPQRMESGPVTVLYEPRMARSLVGHLVGAINGSAVARKTSFLREKLGERIFAPGIRISDTPHVPRGLASRPFDSEGVAAEALDLIDDGVLTAWLLDSHSARQLGLVTNGRASRAGSGTAPSTTNTVLHAGSRSPEEMIAGIEHGILVTELIGRGVNSVTGDYSRGASGFRIKNGELTHPLSEVTIAGNLLDMFASLEPADDLDARYGTDAPSILVEGMTLAGS